MEKFANFKKAGNFQLSAGANVVGELSLNGSSTLLELYSNEYFDVEGDVDICGEFLDRSKVSLINCITKTSRGSGFRGDDHYHFSKVFPHFVVFGNTHLRSTDQLIRQVSFTVDDAPEIFYDQDAFGMVLEPRPHMERIALEHDGKRPLELGEDPHLFYFNGKFELLSTKTSIGRIYVSHGISYNFPGPEGINLRNTISINIQFPSTRNVEEAINSVHDMLRFLEIIAGRPQNVSNLKFLTRLPEDRPTIFDVYWCMPPTRDTESESPPPHPASVLMQEFSKPGQFEKVLHNWIERNNEWRNARFRFSTAFSYQRAYYIDRLVGAANMFDILPSSACPTDVRLSTDLEQARKDARNAFSSLDDSPARNSVLNALGRIGKPTLKNKVQARAAVVTGAVGNLLPELELVLYQAVDCRNYYVHGTEGKFDYSTNPNQVTFFTRTLEFVFATADLIECGWDIEAWMGQGLIRTHPFGEYVEIYTWELDRLKSLLPARRISSKS